MMYAILTAIFVAGLPLGLAAMRRGQAGGWVHLAGLGLPLAGERIYAGDTAQFALSISGLTLLFAGLGLRFAHLRTDDAATRHGHRTALIAQAVALVGVALYGMTLPAIASSFAPEPGDPDRWTVAFSALSAAAVLCGTLPMVWLDLLLHRHPRTLPPGSASAAWQAGLTLALTTSLVFPVNYLAASYDISADYSYFRVTRPGSSTFAVVRNVDEPVQATLFFEPNSEVLAKLQPYFREIADQSDGQFSVRVIDQPAQPGLAEDLNVRDNGYVVLQKGEAKEVFKVGKELKAARRELKTLDGTVQERLLKLARGQRVVYFVIGHGEANTRGGDDRIKLSVFKDLLDAQNVKTDQLAMNDGLGDVVPDDAALVVLAGPETELFDAELKALTAYVDGGGALLVLAEPGRDGMTPLMGHLGLELTEASLAHAAKFIPLSYAVSDRVNLHTTRFGSHPSTKTLSKYSQRGASVAFLGAVGITDAGDGKLPGPRKATELIRSFENTFVDTNGNFEQDADEAGKTYTLAMALEGPQSAPYRVAVVGDIEAAGNFTAQRSKGNAQFLLDASRWLMGDEKLAGEINNEEDVRIQHTREEDTAWFWGAILGVPVLMMLLGAGVVSLRRRKEAQ